MTNNIVPSHADAEKYRKAWLECKVELKDALDSMLDMEVQINRLEEAGSCPDEDLRAAYDEGYQDGLNAVQEVDNG